jgi:hypothetical protein
MRNLVRWPALFVIAFCSLACEKDDAREGRGAPSALPSVAPPDPSSAAVPSGKTPAPSASAAESPAETNGLSGTWEGKYDAKKGDVEMPGKVKDKVRTKDDGKTAIGPGKITLTIKSDGELEGKTEGALGAGTLKGKKVDDDEVSGQFFPDDSLGKQAMYGMFEGKRKEGAIVGRIRVTSGDVTIVREAEFELKKQP